MAAEKRHSGAGRGLRRIARMKDYLGVVPLPGLRHVLCGMDGPGALRQAGAFLRDGCKAGIFATGQLHGAHDAVMLAGPAATSRKVSLGIRGEQRRDQQQAEGNQQRMCYRAAHWHPCESNPEGN